MANQEKLLVVQEKKKEMLFKRMQELFDLSVKCKTQQKEIKNFIVKARTADKLRSDFIDCIDQINILSLDVKDKFVPSYSAVEAFDDLYCNVNDLLVSSEKMKLTKDGNSGNSDGNVLYTKLQPINLPVFSGNIEEWSTFYQLFSKMVHENKMYTDVEKVTHLITHLRGSAKSICSSIPPTAENYNLILKVLIDRFEDKRAIASTYIDKIVKFKVLNFESPQSLDNFLSNFVEPVNALKQMNLPNLADFIFLHIALTKLDSSTSRSFENLNRSNKDMPTFESLVTFVTEQTKILSRYGKNSSGGKTSVDIKTVNLKQAHHINALLTQGPSVPGVSRPTTKGCLLCDSAVAHALYLCPKYKTMNLDDKWTYAKRNKICFNCLSPLHMSNICKSQRFCQIDNCGKKHHSSLHRTLVEHTHTDSSQRSNSMQENPTHSFCSINSSNISSPSTVLLATVSVLANDSNGVTHELRGVLDAGSQSNFLTRKACRKLGLPLKPINSVVKGIGSSPLCVSAFTTFTFHSRIDPSQCYVAQSLVVERLSDRVPTTAVSREHLSHLENLPLADVNFHEPREIEFLIGAELWPVIMGPRKIVAQVEAPVAIETTLGYVIMGRTQIKSSAKSNSLCFFAQSNLDTLVQKFWELEQIPNRTLVSHDDAECEKLFSETCTRNVDGTFTVRLPFRKSPDLLGTSKDACIAKFISLERRLLRNQPLRSLYVNVIDDYVNTGIVSRVGTATQVTDRNAYFMPHHGIHRPNHPSTPLRIVFNASAPTSSSYSLNQLLHVGPKLHADIFRILLNFRLFKFVLMADIKSMFLQIEVHPLDRKFQRFIWRPTPNHHLDVYEINKVVFGNTSSPYLANRVIRLLSSLEKFRYPLAASVAERDVYVDDVVTSTETEYNLNELYEQLNSMFRSGGFTLSKWATNSPLLLSKLPSESRNLSMIDFDRDVPAKVLGVQWSAQKDKFICEVDFFNVSCTKRNMLSVVAHIFDPLGLVAPVTLLAKLIIKELWQQGIDWDETPSLSITQRWEEFKIRLPLLKQISFERHVGIANFPSMLIGFADSSCKAYGACVYVRTSSNDSSAEIKLLCAKSRVAPAKVITIPRLELCAALLLSKLMREVIDCYHQRHSFESVIAFTDSKVVLHWINSDPSRWKIFVGNRISQIHENLNPSHWRHIRGEENPADVLSRGISPDGLINHPLWFNGPPWLTKDETHWPNYNDDNLIDVPEAECKVTTFHSVNMEESTLDTLLDRVSSYRKLLRITAYVFRACTRTNLKTPFIKLEELQRSTQFWIKRVQSLSYPDEIDRLSKCQLINNNLRRLDPFLHEGVVRVGGRLQNAPLSFDQKHPILLPSKGRFVELLIDQYHIDLLHAGQQVILSVLRQKYWIPAARTLIRSRIHKCNSCFRTRPKPILPKMAPLPPYRVEGSRVFEKVGVDYAGPFLITPQRRRGQQILRKVYVCLFICLSVKAVHLELASDLTSECFLAAFKRFLARRGPCTMIISDGGTNFIGARRQLDELGKLISSSAFQISLGGELASKGVEWKINPPNGPWFGGIWESNVKSMKGHLQRLIGNQVLTYEELNTVLVQIEAIMNSRPLCVLSNDPNSPTALTPSHFLTGGVILDYLPAPNVQDVPRNRLQRYQLQDQIIQNFWKRWRQEYLHTLQSRTKWTKDTTPTVEGTVVLLMKDNVPPLHWPLGVVERVYPGADGVVRVVDVRTQTGSYRRPVGRICPLPTQ